MVHETLRQLRLDGRDILLRPRELELLRLLHGVSPRWVTVEALCMRLLGEGSRKKRAILWQAVHGLRSKLGRLAPHLDYVRGKGYRCLLDIEYQRLKPAIQD